jgi:epoxyqueuosine reductase
MGNSLNPDYVSDLIRAFQENRDDRVQSMIAWALGHIGGTEAKTALEDLLHGASGMVKEEIKHALKIKL